MLQETSYSMTVCGYPKRIKEHFAERQKMAINLMYIDPRTDIRDSSDNVYYTLLVTVPFIVNSDMVGYSGFTVSPVNGRHAAGNRKTEQGGDKDSVINQASYIQKISAEAKQRKNQRPN